MSSEGRTSCGPMPGLLPSAVPPTPILGRIFYFNKLSIFLITCFWCNPLSWGKRGLPGPVVFFSFSLKFCPPGCWPKSQSMLFFDTCGFLCFYDFLPPQLNLPPPAAIQNYRLPNPLLFFQTLLKIVLNLSLEHVFNLYIAVAIIFVY